MNVQYHLTNKNSSTTRDRPWPVCLGHSCDFQQAQPRPQQDRGKRSSWLIPLQATALLSTTKKKGRPQPYSQIVTASTPHKGVHSAMTPSCEAAGDVGRGLGMGSNTREQPDAGSSSTLWSQHSSAVKPSFHVRKMERTTLCVNPRLSHTDTLIHCKCT